MHKHTYLNFFVGILVSAGRFPWLFSFPSFRLKFENFCLSWVFHDPWICNNFLNELSFLILTYPFPIESLSTRYLYILNWTTCFVIYPFMYAKHTLALWPLFQNGTSVAHSTCNQSYSCWPFHSFQIEIVSGWLMYSKLSLTRYMCMWWHPPCYHRCDHPILCLYLELWMCMMS